MWSVNKRLDVKIAIALVKNIKMNETDRAYQEIRQIAKEYQKKYENYQISKIPRINYSRQLFKAIGLDPTKRRPSSESLLRRAIKDKPFYQVNTLVDIGNWCSLEFLLPICVYDADKIIGDVYIDIGTEKDEYEALNNEIINFRNRYVLRDEKGAFGSPMTDSKRTSISLNSHNAYLLITAPKSYQTDNLIFNQKVFIDRVIGTCGGILENKKILENTIKPE